MFQSKVANHYTDFHEPLAIVGMACRFPGGVATLDDYWSLMAEGRDGICEIPADRLDIDKFYDSRANAPGKIFVRHGGFLTQPLDSFDAEYFGMSPREAAYLDPQQRLLMEVAVEAIEDAGQPLDRIRGSDTGVFIGGFMIDGMLTQFSPLARHQIGQHSAVSSTLTILSNRLSYFLDLHGPSFTLDTACSSSLVAMHQACQAIRHGECSQAIAGGVNVIFRPETLVAMCKGGFLSRDGRSKSFDARADGYGRGEGAGIVLIKRLSDAQAAGDRIHAVIRGTGVNQDGRTDGITQPNGDAQAALIQSVCERQNIGPESITYVEAHGTGTAIGDPTELRALAKVFGAARLKDQQPCLVGSVKANIGHLEAAAGIAAVIKTALCLDHAAVPPVANLETVNPALDLEGWKLDLPRRLTPLPAAPDGASGRAAINSFGYGGTNASLIMERAPARNDSRVPVETTRPTVLVMSARSTQALNDLAAAYILRLDGLDARGFLDLCYSAAVRRTAYEFRLAVVADDAAKASAALRDHLEGRANPAVVQGHARRRETLPAFVFTGMGPQWWGMGRELLEAEPVYHDAAQEIDAQFREIAGWSILEELSRSEAESRVTRTEIAQPANFLLQVALFKLLDSLGVRPAALVGHSVGEVSAAYAAGVLSLADALRVSYQRAKLQATTAGLGGMLAVGVSPERAATYLAGYEDKVSIAAANGPASITLAGDEDALDLIAARLSDDGLFNRRLQVETAYHSPVMDPLLDPLETALSGIDPQPAALPLYSTVTALPASGTDFGAVYWRHNVRDCVRFADTVREMIDEGHECFLEIGPHPVLMGSLRECLLDANVEGMSAMTLRRNHPELLTLMRGIASLHVAGVSIDWARFFATAQPRYVPLPTYPWQRRAHWNEGQAAREDRLGSPAERTLLGKRQDDPLPTWRSGINRNRLAYIFDHKVEGSVVLPGAAYCEIALELAAALDARGPWQLSQLTFSQALLIGETDEVAIVTSLNPDRRHFAIHSSIGDNWMLHAAGTLSSRSVVAPDRLDMARLANRLTQTVSPEAHYADMDARGLHYGPAFRGVRDLRLSADHAEMLASIEAPQGLALSQDILHPALLDACFQALIAMLTGSKAPVAYVPVRIDEIVVHKAPGGRFMAHGVLLGDDGTLMQADLRLIDEDGNVLVEMAGIHARSLGAGAPEDNIDHLISRFELEPTELFSTDTVVDKPFVILADPVGHALRVAQKLAAIASVTVIDDELPLPHDIKRSGIHLVDFRALSGADDPVGLAGMLETLALLQALPQDDGERRKITFVLPLRAGHPEAVALEAAARLGLICVAANEYSSFDIRIIQVDLAHDCTGRLVAELCAVSDEDDVVLTREARLVRRLRHVPARRMNDEATARRGSDNPDKGTLEVEVIAWTQGTEGSDVLGVVRRSGEEGRQVLLRHAGTPARYLRTPAHSVVDAPMECDESEALATLPLALAAAMLAKTGMKAGHKVLIHPDEGDLAAALAAATRLMGGEVVKASNSLTPSRDVLQNSPAGIDILCVVDKDDIASALWPAIAELGTVLDLSGDDQSWPAGRTVLRLDPAVFAAHAATHLAWALSGVLGAPAQLRRDFAEGRGDLRRHVIGTAGAAKETAILASAKTPTISVAGTYLVTGGFGGFGFEIAKWLAAKGAGHIVLAGRSGMASPGADAMLRALADLGAEASGVAIDIADPHAVTAMIEGLANANKPLLGLFHAAGVLDDAPVYLLTADQADRVMRPKAQGAWNLHLATRALELDAFVTISSVAALLGSPGQGAYAAANTFLDTLVHHRRLDGLPGISINLGALADVGMAARHDGVERHFARVGVGSLKPAEALMMMDRVLGWNPVNLGVAPMDWSLWGGTYAKWAASPRYRHVVPANTTTERAMDGANLGILAPEERLTFVEQTLNELIGSILRLPVDAIDTNHSLLNMGVDSLMAMELQAGIDRRLGLKVPTLELMKGVPVSALIRNVSAMISRPETTADTGVKDEPRPEPAPRRTDIGALLAQLDHMSPEEIERTIAVLEETGLGE